MERSLNTVCVASFWEPLGLRDTVSMWRMATLSIILVGLSLGCKEPEETASEDPSAATSAVTGGGDIAPMGGVGAGPMTPVSGTENLQGGGSAAGSVLKDRAKGVAAQPPSSLNQAGGDEGP